LEPSRHFKFWKWNIMWWFSPSHLGTYFETSVFEICWTVVTCGHFVTCQ
jgi:hypothetical protein